MLIKALESEQQHIEMTDEDLSLVRRYALRDIKPEEVWLGKQRLCNTRRDRSGETFPKSYLDRFAATGLGKSVMPGHDYGQLPLGRYYKFAVGTSGDHYQLDAWYFLNAKNERLIADVELGVLKDVSIGFNSGPRTCDLCGNEWGIAKGECNHWPLREYDGVLCTLTYAESGVEKAEMMEGSFVWHGCQFDAQAVPKQLMHVSNGTGTGLSFVDATHYWQLGGMPIQPKENTVTPQEMEAEILRLKGLTLSSDREKALEAKVAELETKALLAPDGEKYHDFLKKELFRMADALDVANRDEGKAKRKMYETLLANIKTADASTLEGMRDSLAVEFNARFSNGTGSTSGAGGEQDTKGKNELLARIGGGAYL